jgi:FkbM family methyltransferase
MKPLAIRSSAYALLAPYFKNIVYRQRTGICKGLKRRGGFGFIPTGKPLSREHERLSQLDFQGQNIYDVGGYIGLLSMFFAQAAGPTGRVFTFEPNPENVAAIRDHAALNGFTNVLVVPIALSSRAETLKFVVPQSSSARGTAHSDRQEIFLQQASTKVLKVEADALDHQIEARHLPAPDFVKIDAEGLELEVLLGMSATLARHRPVLWLELHSAKSPEVVRLLADQNYRLYRVEGEGELTADNAYKAHGHFHAIPGGKAN